jgi:hypothetical protein
MVDKAVPSSNVVARICFGSLEELGGNALGMLFSMQGQYLYV